MNRMEHGHGNKVGKHSPDPNPPTLRKVPATSVPYGESISRNGRTVWLAMDGDLVVCVAATSTEARRRFQEIRRSLNGAVGGDG